MINCDTQRLTGLALLILLVFAFVAPANAEGEEYRIFLTDGTEGIFQIVSNDPASKRLQIQKSGSAELAWVSYYRVMRIIEEVTQKDVTNVFVVTDRLIPSDSMLAPQIEPVKPAEPVVLVQPKSGMGSGTVIAVSILGTIASLVLLGAMAN